MSIEKKVIQCKKYPITYTLVIKQVKNINMRISPKGEVVVSANPFIPMEKIDDFVSSKISWIIEHQNGTECENHDQRYAYPIVWKRFKDQEKQGKIQSCKL